MVYFQYTHLSTTTQTRRLNSLTGLIEHIDVTARTASVAVSTTYQCELGTDKTEVITHSTTTSHGFSCFGQSIIDADNTMIVSTGKTVTYRHHETVDQSTADISTGIGHDPSATYCFMTDYLAELFVDRSTLGFSLLLIGHEASHTSEVVINSFRTVQILLVQHIDRDLLITEQLHVRCLIRVLFHFYFPGY